MILCAGVINILSKNDELKVYRGEDFKVNDFITIHQPTLGEICDYGESQYYNMVYLLTSTPQSLKAQLWEAGTDYTTITPYWVFYNIIAPSLTREMTALIFGDFDFSKLKKYEDDTGVVLCEDTEYNESTSEENIRINESDYKTIVDYLCQVHSIKQDLAIPANESTKMILIEDAIEDMKINQEKEKHSVLLNLVSAMINSDGFKYSHTQVWDMKINAFMDSVKRISQIKNSTLLLQSGYSGFGVNLKDIDKKQLDWLGELKQ